MDDSINVDGYRETRQVDDEQIRIPVIEETLQVGKQFVEGGGVRIVKTVSTEEVTVDEPTVHESVVVERIAINRLLDAEETLPTSRTEGTTLIVPIFEEVILIEKRVRLTEELHIRQSRAEVVNPQSTTLRRESVRIEPITTEDLLSKQD